MKKVVLVFFLMGFLGFAQQKNKNKEVIIKVSGSCKMCEKRIEKAALSVKGVKSAEWHIDCQDVHLLVDESKFVLEDVKKAITAVGHDVDGLKASDEAYDKIHECCKYREE